MDSPAMGKRIVLSLFLICGVSLSLPAAARWLELQAIVTDVLDGDNLRVVDRRRVVHLVRLSGIDAPELSQLGGKAARDRLRELVLEKKIRIEHRYFDQKGRLLGRVFLPEPKGDTGEKNIWVNRIMLEEGHAWFADPDGDAPELEAVESEARRENRGIWKRSNPIPPWYWCRGVRIMRDEPVRPPRPRFPRYQSANEPKLLGGP